MSKIEIESPYPRHAVMYWYPPQEATQYKQEHVLWLLRHRRELRANCYPGGGECGGYIADSVATHRELMSCLNQCELDGLILLFRESFDMSEIELSECFNQPTQEIIKRAQTALRYVSGKLRHDDWDPITYQEFKRLAELADKELENS